MFRTDVTSAMLPRYAGVEVTVLKKLTALVVLGFAASLCLLMGASGPASADTYGPQVPTQTHIDVLVAEDGKSIQVEFWTTANSDQQPTGELDIAIARGNSAAAMAQAAPAVYRKSVHFSGKHIVVDGPTLRPGRYVVSAEFTPDNPDLFLPSDNVKPVQIKRDGGGSTDNDSDNGIGGLPNTGGPDLAWLLLGLGLVGAGAGTVTYARRRTAQVSIPA